MASAIICPFPDCLEYPCRIEFVPSVVALSLALAVFHPCQARKACRQAGAAPPLRPSSNWPTISVPMGEARLQAVVDRFNKESGGNAEAGASGEGRQAGGLNLMRRYDVSEVLSAAQGSSCPCTT
jgi:hypothetical protein